MSIERIKKLESQVEELRDQLEFHLSDQQEPMVHMVIETLMQRAKGATVDNLTRLFNSIRIGRKGLIQAMKEVRTITSCDLKEAKDFVDWVHDCNESA